MTEQELAHFTDFIAAALNEGECKGVRFILTIWCDCATVPDYSASNDHDVGRVLKMMKCVSDRLMVAPPIEPNHVGHA